MRKLNSQFGCKGTIKKSHKQTFGRIQAFCFSRSTSIWSIWKWTKYFQGSKSEPSLLILPLPPYPLPLFPLLPSPFLFSPALQLPFVRLEESRARPKLNQCSSPPPINQGEKKLSKKVSNECMHLQTPVSARVLISDKGRAFRDHALAQVRRFKNPDNH